MQVHKIIALLVGISALLMSGCGGGGGSTSPASTPKITAAIITQITGSNAVSTISISGATSPIIYGFQATVNYPAGSTYTQGSVTAIGVNSGNFVVDNPSQGSVSVASASTTGFGSGDVLRVTFSNVPVTVQATDFTLTNFVAKDSNGVAIP